VLLVALVTGTLIGNRRHISMGARGFESSIPVRRTTWMRRKSSSSPAAGESSRGGARSVGGVDRPEGRVRRFSAVRKTSSATPDHARGPRGAHSRDAGDNLSFQLRVAGVRVRFRSASFAGSIGALRPSVYARWHSAATPRMSTIVHAAGRVRMTGVLQAA